MPFDFDFKEAYGKEFDEMSQGEKEQAIMSQLYYMRKGMDTLNGKTKLVPKLEKIAWAGVITIPGIIGWLIWLTKAFFGVK